MKLAGWLGAALIFGTNAIALIGVLGNRSGTPESQLVLSERELWPERSLWSESENSGLALQLDWRVAFAEIEGLRGGYLGQGYGPTAWLDAKKLAELGFDVSKPIDPDDSGAFYDRLLPRDVFLVLELDGPAYQAALERARQHARRAADLLAARPGDEELEQRAKGARESLFVQEHISTRLWVIDAGLDREALRARYPDRTRFALVRGQIRAQPVGRRTDLQLWGDVESLSIESIHVALSHRAAVAPLLHERKRSDQPPEWSAAITLAFGQRLEPWITELSLAKREVPHPKRARRAVQ